MMQEEEVQQGGDARDANDDSDEGEDRVDDDDDNNNKNDGMDEDGSSSSNERMEDDDMEIDDEDESEMLRSHPLLAFLSSEFVTLDSSATALNASTSLCCTLRSELATAYLFYFCKIYRRDCPATPTEWIPRPGTPHWFTNHASDVLRKARSSLGIHLVFRMRRKWINGEFVYGRWCFGAQVDPVLLVDYVDPSLHVSTRRQAAEQILGVCQAYSQELQDAGLVPRETAGVRHDQGLVSSDLVNAWPSAFVYENSTMVLDTDADSQESSDFASSSATPSSEGDESSSSDGADAQTGKIARQRRPQPTETAGATSATASARPLATTAAAVAPPHAAATAATTSTTTASSSSSSYAAASTATRGSTSRHRKRGRADMTGTSGASDKRRKASRELVWDGKRWRSARRDRSQTGLVKDERCRPLRSTVRSIFGMLHEADREAAAKELYYNNNNNNNNKSQGGYMHAQDEYRHMVGYEHGDARRRREPKHADAALDDDDDIDEEDDDKMGLWRAQRPDFPSSSRGQKAASGHNARSGFAAVRQISASSSSSSNASISSAGSTSSRKTASSVGAGSSGPGARDTDLRVHMSSSSSSSNQMVNSTNITSSSSSSSSSRSHGTNKTGSAPGAPLSSAMSTTSTASAASMTSAASATEDIPHSEFDAWLDRHHREFSSGKRERAPYEGKDYSSRSGTRAPPRGWDESFKHMGQASLDYVTTPHAPWYKRDAYQRLDDRGPINVEHALAHAAENGARAMDGLEVDGDGQTAREGAKSVAKELRSQSATVSMLAAQGVTFTRALLKQMVYVRSLRSLKGSSEVLDILLLLAAAVRVVPHFGLPASFVDHLASECVSTLEASGHEQLLADLLQRATSEGILRCLAAIRPKREHFLTPCERKELQDNFTVVRDLLLHVTG